MSEPPKYAKPYPAQGDYQGPPVVAPPQYATQPQRRGTGILEWCIATMCFFCLMDGCCELLCCCCV